MMLERIYYYDGEILKLYEHMEEYGIPTDCILTTDELSLAFGMTLVLEPIRAFTKFVQHRNEITLAYVPGLIDKLISDLARNVFAPKLVGRPAIVLEQVNALQSELVKSIRARYAETFLGGSLALAARSLLPGEGLLRFTNFDVTEQILEEVKENILDDLIALLPSDTPEDEIEDTREAARTVLKLAWKKLSKVGPNAYPLTWWPLQTDLSILFPVAKMLFGIPSSSADNERAFSSASLTLDLHRYRLDIETFRKEHRIRRYFASGSDPHTKVGRDLRITRLNYLLDRYTAETAARANAGANINDSSNI